MDYIVRKICLDDASRVRKVLAAVSSERRFLCMTEIPSQESTIDFIKNNLEHGHAHYVAEVDSTVIGWADLLPRCSFSTTAHVGVLGMGIMKEFRGQGIGEALLEVAITHAWSKGLTRLELDVFADNKRAIHLYKKHGYKIEGVKKHARYIDDTYQDILMMAQYRV